MAVSAEELQGELTTDREPHDTCHLLLPVLETDAGVNVFFVRDFQ